MMKSDHKTSRGARPGAILLSLLLALVWIAGSGILLAHEDAALTSAGTGAPGDSEEVLLAIYVLAFDNSGDAINTVNLTTKYTETVDSIVAATAGLERVTAVILADLDQYGDTHILLAQNGQMESVAGLPDQQGIIDASITEYNTADGPTLGGFLQWARQGRTHVRTYLSYIAHGAPLAPKSAPSIPEIVMAPSETARAASAIILPMSVGANPDFTDSHDADPDNPYPQLLTPYDLAVALKMTVQDSGPLDVLDLVHCFAASIEELYEVSPYAHTTVAAPNYAFFDPRMVGTALREVANLLLDPDPPADPALAMAFDIKDSYIHVIPTYKHPYVLVVVDNSKLPLVKQRWDALSAVLLNRFAQDPVTTANNLRDAYLHAAANGGVYDTTFCGQEAEYKLEAPDALTDISSLSTALGAIYGSGSDVQSAAAAVNQAIDQAVRSVIKRSGLPWWVANPSEWTFGSGASGIALFTPLLPMEVSGTTYHAWQSLWYTNTYTIAQRVETGIGVVDIENPHPYQFITREDGGTTWADVLNAFWHQREQHPLTEGVALCLPDIQEIEEIDVYLMAETSADPVKAGENLVYTLLIKNRTTLTATTVVLTNMLPADVTFTAVSPASDCQHHAGVITCNLPPLGGHGTHTVVIEGRVGMYHEGSIQNVAEVSVAGEKRIHDNRWIQDTLVNKVWWAFIPSVSSMP